MCGIFLKYCVYYTISLSQCWALVLHQLPNICAVILQINCNVARITRWGNALYAVNYGRGGWTVRLRAVNSPDTFFILPLLQAARLLKRVLTKHRKGLIFIYSPPIPVISVNACGGDQRGLWEWQTVSPYIHYFLQNHRQSTPTCCQNKYMHFNHDVPLTVLLLWSVDHMHLPHINVWHS